MAMSLLRSISDLIALGGVAQSVGDVSLSSTILYSGTLDFGADIFRRGGFRIRTKGGTLGTGSSTGAGPGSQATLAVQTAEDVSFTVSVVTVANLVLASIAGFQTMVGEFAIDPNVFRYMRLAALGNTGAVATPKAQDTTTSFLNNVTIDWDAVAVP